MLLSSWVLLLTCVIWIALAVMALASDTRFAVGLRPRLLTLLGVALILGGFFQPWLNLDFLRYVRLGPDVLTAFLPEVLQQIGPEPVAKVLFLLERVTHLNGWQMQLVPFYNVPTRLAAVAPLLLAMAALVWTPWGASLAGSRACKAVGGILTCLSLALLVALTAAAPILDALGQPQQLEWSLLTVLLGVRVGNGVWLTLVGLLLLAIGGVVEVVDQGPGAAATSLPEATW